MKNKLISKIKSISSISISIFFLYIVIKKMNIDTVFSSLKEINLIFLIPIFIFLCLFYISFAYRWKIMFINFKKKPKFKNIFIITIITYMGNNVLPARLGEIMRLYIVNKKEKIKPATTLATIAIEKIFDGLAIMTFFIIVLFFSNETKSHLYTLEEFSYRQIKIAGYIISGGYLLLMFLLILMRNQIKFLVKLPGKSKNLLSKKISIKIRNFLFSFGRGLSTFKKFKDITNIYLTSALTWIFHALIIYFCLESCNIHLTISASFFLLAFIGMAYLIPSSPGAIGTLEFFIILGLSCYGIDKDRALVFALIYHVIEIIPVCILGLYLFIKESINIKSIEV